MKRGALIVVLAATMLASGEQAAAETCAGDMRGQCLVRPHFLLTGAHTYVRGIRWKAWTHSTALGFGQLVERGGATYPGFKKRAKIRLRFQGRCQGRFWFFSMTINFGPHYRKRYLQRYEFTPCSL